MILPGRIKLKETITQSTIVIADTHRTVNGKSLQKREGGEFKQKNQGGKAAFWKLEQNSA